MPKPVIVYGTRYPSLSAAADALGLTRQALSWRLKRGTVEPDGEGQAGRPAKPAAALAKARDGYPEIKVSGIPVTVLERIDRYVKRKGLRGRSWFMGQCIRAHFERLEKRDRKKSTGPADAA